MELLELKSLLVLELLLPTSTKGMEVSTSVCMEMELPTRARFPRLSTWQNCGTFQLSSFVKITTMEWELQRIDMQHQLISTKEETTFREYILMEWTSLLSEGLPDLPLTTAQSKRR